MTRLCVKLTAVLLAVALAAGGAAASDMRLRWDKVSLTTSTKPPALKDFGIGYDPKRNNLLAFGGRGPLDSTWRFDIDAGSWSKVADSGTKPDKRFSMIAGVDHKRDRFLVAMGEQTKSLFFNDVWALNLTSLTWSKVATKGTPPRTRYGAVGGVFVFESDYLVVSHGFEKDRYKDSFALRLSDDTWINTTPHGDGDDIPFARCLSGGVAADKSRLVMFGGCGSGGWGPCPAQDTWLLRFQQGTTATPSRTHAAWRKLGTCARPKTFPAMAISPGNVAGSDAPTSVVSHIVSLGGQSRPYSNGDAGEISILDLATEEWTIVNPYAPNGAPSHLSGHQMAYVSRGNTTHMNAGDYVLVFGGGTDDVWKLSVDTSQPIDAVGCPFIFDLRALHAVLMLLSWGFLLPIGATVARFYKHWQPKGRWFAIHRPMQMTGVILSLGGFICAMLMVQLNKFSALPHAIFGSIVFLFGTLQPVNAYFRPHKHEGQPVERKRLIWEYIHKYCGRLALLLGLINPIQGLFYIGAHISIIVLYCIWVAAVVLFYVYKTIQGEPDSSPVAQWVNMHTVGEKDN
eukprot:TRINITY_DN65816_c6_g2_i1.p1 TRINITY_DN65816_c6_g2~~TRINITY_DN65816_c6_g2_i1.p1  ORF type:complete len:570 (-),score=249.81 TRINITY_DN65816_c6_g2_i1:517-2226(-)